MRNAVGTLSVLVILLFLPACSSSSAPPPPSPSPGAEPDDSPPAAGSAEKSPTRPPQPDPGPSPDPDPPSATTPSPPSKAGSPPVEGLLLWLEETVGYVPVDLAERAHKYPLRFALFEDGTLVYRNDRFQHFKVQLTSREVETLLGEVVDTGFLELAALFENPEQSLVVLDGGSETVGVRWQGRARTVVLAGGARFLARTYPGNPRIRTAKGVRDRLAEYRHPRAKPHQP